MIMEKEIKEALKAKKLVMGSNSVIRGVKTGHIKTVVHASNFPENSMADLKHYKQLGGITLEKFDGTSKQLGELCGKPFNILVVGLKSK